MLFYCYFDQLADCSLYTVGRNQGAARKGTSDNDGIAHDAKLKTLLGCTNSDLSLQKATELVEINSAKSRYSNENREAMMFKYLMFRDSEIYSIKALTN